ncbi:unnamed protein product, partial [Effrenium voratum]
MASVFRATKAIAEAAKRSSEEALQRLALLRRSNVELDSAAHHAALAPRGAWRGAQRLARRMAQDGISYNSITFTLLLGACRSGRRWQQASALLKNAEEMRTRLEVKAWNVALGICASAEHAFQRLRQMRGAMLRPDEVSYGAVVTSCS